MKMNLRLAAIVDRHKMKTEVDKLKMKKIKKYVQNMENRFHYDLVAIVILIGVVIVLPGLSRRK
jgi:hypothetical protein